MDSGSFAIPIPVLSGDRDGNPDELHEGHVIEDSKIKVKRPVRYKVLLHNDDYTTMEFVVVILQKFFHKKQYEAESIMSKIHKDGMAVCGIYTFEVAESKKVKVTQYSEDFGHPLICSIESE